MENIRHVLTAEIFDGLLLKYLFVEAEGMRKQSKTIKGRRDLLGLLRGYNITLLFEETSTRTFTSFYRAAQSLGMNISGIQDPKLSSMYEKNEALSHTCRVLAGYEADVLVLRLKERGMVGQMAEIIDTPLINAGDGDGEHPTQTLVDLYTVWQKFGRLDNLTWAFCGDLFKGRTVHSNVRRVSQFEGSRIILVSPDGCALPASLKKLLDERRVSYEETTDMRAALRDADIFYQTRLQIERFEREISLLKVVVDRMAADDFSEDSNDLHKLEVLLTRNEIEYKPGDLAGILSHPQVKAQVLTCITNLERVLSNLIVSTKKYQIGVSELEIMPANSILLHPLPINQRQQEITNEVSDMAMLPRHQRKGHFKKAMYFEQSDGGLVRRALLKYVVLGREG